MKILKKNKKKVGIFEVPGHEKKGKVTLLCKQ